MFRFLTRALLVGALCLAIGGHWIALQSVAWGTMLVRNAQSASLSEAVAKTFDGTHPCSLCKGIDAAQHSEKKNEAAPTTLKPDLICSLGAIIIAPRARDVKFSALTASASARFQTPPTPPPRRAFA